MDVYTYDLLRLLCLAPNVASLLELQPLESDPRWPAFIAKVQVAVRASSTAEPVGSLTPDVTVLNDVFPLQSKMRGCRQEV